jgi:hypothetical protein
VVQAFLHGRLDDADIYIQAPARYPLTLCGYVLKLLRAIYGLHQAPVKFKQEVVAWFKANKYTAANSSETIWIKREGNKVLTHGLYADDFLHHTNDTAMFKKFNWTLPNDLKLNQEQCQSILIIGSLLTQTN